MRVLLVFSRVQRALLYLAAIAISILIRTGTPNMDGHTHGRLTETHEDVTHEDVTHEDVCGLRNVLSTNAVPTVASRLAGLDGGCA